MEKLTFDLNVEFSYLKLYFQQLKNLKIIFLVYLICTLKVHINMTIIFFFSELIIYILKCDVSNFGPITSSTKVTFSPEKANNEPKTSIIFQSLSVINQ